MHSLGNPRPSSGSVRLIFNVAVLILSIFLMFFLVLVWGIWDFYFIASYAISTMVSLVCLYYLKRALLGSYSSEPERMRVQESVERGGRSPFYVWFVAVIIIMITPLLLLLFLPQFWLVILNGIVSGAVISEIALYIQGE